MAETLAAVRDLRNDGGDVHVRGAARAFGRVAASFRATGRKVRARSYDAMIAATAPAHGLPLDTANPDDFRGIAGIGVRVVEAGANG